MRPRSVTERRRSPGPNDPGSDSGSILVVAAITVCLVSAVAAALLNVAIVHARLVDDSAHGVVALQIAEGAIDVSLAEIAADSDVDGDGLGVVSGTLAGGSYEVTISPALSDEGPYVLQARATLGPYARTLEVILERGESSGFPYGFFGADAITAVDDVVIDSYDSRLGDYAAQATNTYGGISYAKAGGNLGSNGSITVQGDAAVLGSATPGPAGTVTVGPSALVSDSTAPGSEVIALDIGTYEPPGTPAPALELGSKDTMTITTGVYHFAAMRVKSKAQLTFEGEVDIYVDSDFKVRNMGLIVLKPNARVRIFVGGIAQSPTQVPTIDVGGKGIVNESGLPGNLTFNYYGQETVRLKGAADFYGVILSPEGDVDASGDAHYYGALVGKSLSLSADVRFHYDEAVSLGGSQVSELQVVSWRDTETRADQ